MYFMYLQTAINCRYSTKCSAIHTIVKWLVYVLPAYYAIHMAHVVFLSRMVCHNFEEYHIQMTAGILTSILTDLSAALPSDLGIPQMCWYTHTHIYVLIQHLVADAAYTLYCICDRLSPVPIQSGAINPVHQNAVFKLDQVRPSSASRQCRQNGNVSENGGLLARILRIARVKPLLTDCILQ
ncbi:hypothetical protein F4859DRAFT_498659 [Xylaria cf. heliscus]|nr:hypothetical protein F4859DRAFT_498659 [Xylaria cf. heliscus]